VTLKSLKAAKLGGRMYVELYTADIVRWHVADLRQKDVPFFEDESEG
jgi:hypothetical protein